MSLKAPTLQISWDTWLLVDDTLDTVRRLHSLPFRSIAYQPLIRADMRQGDKER